MRELSGETVTRRRWEICPVLSLPVTASLEYSHHEDEGFRWEKTINTILRGFEVVERLISIDRLKRVGRERRLEDYKELLGAESIG